MEIGVTIAVILVVSAFYHKLSTIGETLDSIADQLQYSIRDGILDAQATNERAARLDSEAAKKYGV